jgi:hypothetical protein
MSCAIKPFLMAHQWRKPPVRRYYRCLSKNQWRIGRAIRFFPTAHRWHNGALSRGRTTKKFHTPLRPSFFRRFRSCESCACVRVESIGDSGSSRRSIDSQSDGCGQKHALLLTLLGNGTYRVSTVSTLGGLLGL